MSSRLNRANLFHMRQRHAGESSERLVRIVLAKNATSSLYILIDFLMIPEPCI